MPELGQRVGASRACPGRAAARPGPDARRRPSATSARRCSCGTCSWSRVTAAQPRGERPQRGEVRRRARPHVRGDLRRGLAGPGREHPQRLPERDRGLVRHPGQLAGADHADDGQADGVLRRDVSVHGAGSLPARSERARSGTIDQSERGRDGAGRHPAALPRRGDPPPRAGQVRDRRRHHLGHRHRRLPRAQGTVLETKPLTAKIIAVLVATIVSYVLNREWSFRTRGGRERHHEAAAVLPDQRHRRRGLHRAARGLAVRAGPQGARGVAAHRRRSPTSSAARSSARSSGWRSAGGRSGGSCSRTRTCAARCPRPTHRPSGAPR